MPEVPITFGTSIQIQVKLFKGYLPQILLSPLLNIWTQMGFRKYIYYSHELLCGCPQRVHGDRGVENYGDAEYML